MMLLASPRPIRITKIVKMKIAKEASNIEPTRLADVTLIDVCQSNVMHTVTVQAKTVEVLVEFSYSIPVVTMMLKTRDHITLPGRGTDW